MAGEGIYLDRPEKLAFRFSRKKLPFDLLTNRLLSIWRRRRRNLFLKLCHFLLSPTLKNETAGRERKFLSFLLHSTPCDFIFFFFWSFAVENIFRLPIFSAFGLVEVCKTTKTTTRTRTTRNENKYKNDVPGRRNRRHVSSGNATFLTK